MSVCLVFFSWKLKWKTQRHTGVCVWVLGKHVLYTFAYMCFFVNVCAIVVPVCVRGCLRESVLGVAQ